MKLSQKDLGVKHRHIILWCKYRYPAYTLEEIIGKITGVASVDVPSEVKLKWLLEVCEFLGIDGYSLLREIINRQERGIYSEKTKSELVESTFRSAVAEVRVCDGEKVLIDLGVPDLFDWKEVVFISDTDKKESFNLFGEMRGLTKEEGKALGDFYSKAFSPTGVKLYRIDLGDTCEEGESSSGE